MEREDRSSPSLFCTNCGAVISGDARFCTVCGSAREVVEESAPPPTGRTRRRTWPWWMLALIAAFLLGLWLGRGPAAKRSPLCGTPATVDGGGGKLIKGPGEPLKSGSGGGESPSLSGGGNSTKVSGNGKEGVGVDDDGDLPGGGHAGKGTLADDDGSASAAGSDPDQLGHDLTKFEQGKGMNLGPAEDGQAPVLPEGKSYSAKDFTYDKTNLPRYPDAVSSVASSVSYGPDGRTDTYSTGAGIVTSSSFDTVVSWYRQNLPPGWKSMTIGDMQQLSQQLSLQSLTQMLGGASPSAPAAASSAASSASPDPIRIALFSPPPGSTAKSGVMIVQHGNSPVEALLQAKVAPPP